MFRKRRNAVYICFVMIRFRAIVIVVVVLVLTILLLRWLMPRRVDDIPAWVPVLTVEINRYEKKLFEISPNLLSTYFHDLRINYPPFFVDNQDDSAKIASLYSFVTDQKNRALYEAVIQKYASLNWLSEEMAVAFRRMIYLFPDWNPPMVYTYVSGLYIENPVLYNAEYLVIAMDMFLGEGFDKYLRSGMPMYMTRTMDSPYILSSVIETIIRFWYQTDIVFEHLLDRMISEGKKLYVLDRILPHTNDEYKIGYTAGELHWCQINESNLWSYFIENELLYVSDPLIVNRYTREGPFTSTFGRESPARTAIWIGWQIVRQYMHNNPETPVEEMLALPSKQILQESGYRPGRI